MNRLTLISKWRGLSVLLLLPGLAAAQTNGSITFGPVGTSIPTLGGTALLLVALFLGFLAYQAIRKNQGRGNAISLLAGTLVIGSLASAAGGFALMRDADAAVMGFTIDIPAGKVFSFGCGPLNYFDNKSGVPMQVNALTLPPNCTPLTHPSVPTCTLYSQLTNSARCVIDCDMTLCLAPSA
ncbi:hypothetical protein CCR95_06390 [Thiocystis minor]|uniref:midcut-by-XrtH protein n=1 Tax=Thiocystis minor TaxID=61597 RepID=UPI00191203FB|nr:midcut-by-XrtH protein [Thiocystis minor]MBK5963722.1 hypothetical protein [Thiocystis minor]